MTVWLVMYDPYWYDEGSTVTAVFSGEDKAVAWVKATVKPNERFHYEVEEWPLDPSPAAALDGRNSAGSGLRTDPKRGTWYPLNGRWLLTVGTFIICLFPLFRGRVDVTAALVLAWLTGGVVGWTWSEWRLQQYAAKEIDQ